MYASTHWNVLYLRSVGEKHSTMAIRRSDGYCLCSTGDYHPALLKEYAGLRWIHEYADTDDIAPLLEWLAAEDEEHPITWHTYVGNKRMKVAMGKVNAGQVAICVFHFKFVHEVISRPLEAL